VPREEKVAQVNELAELIAGCRVGILMDYRGISAGKATLLRRQLRKRQVKVRVVKNTLARFAAKKAGRDDLAELFSGPVAMLTSIDDEVEPARALDEFLRGAGVDINIKGGFFPGRLLNADEVKALAKLPTRDILIAQVIGGIQAPIGGLVNCLAAPIRGLAVVLQARKEQLEAN